MKNVESILLSLFFIKETHSGGIFRWYHRDITNCSIYYRNFDTLGRKASYWRFSVFENGKWDEIFSGSDEQMISFLNDTKYLVKYKRKERLIKLLPDL